MKISIFSVFLSLFFSFNIHANAQINRPLLFEIQKNGNTAYLLGTIHTGYGYSSLPSYVSEKIDTAGTLVIESDLDAAQVLFQSKFPLPSPVSLKSQLTEGQWKILVAELTPLGATEEKLDTFYPFVATSLLSLVQLPQIADPMDVTIAQIAKATGKQLDFLESAEAALNVLEVTQGLDVLKATLDTPKAEVVNSTDALLKTYLDGDEEALLLLVKNEKTLSPNGFKVLITDRNKAWIPEINRIVQNSGVEFFAFGAGHLGGTDGVIALLKNNGFAVNRIEK